MKEIKELQINDKKYEIYYTIGDLRKMEREIGQSLISILTKGPVVIDMKVDIDFIISALHHGLHDKEYTDDELYNMIDEYCSQEGIYTLDRLGGIALRAILETGFFISSKKMKMLKGDQSKASENGQTKPKE